MKKNIIIIIINTIILFGIVGITVNLSPLIEKPLTAFSLSLLKLSSPVLIYNNAKATFSNSNSVAEENTTNTVPEEERSVMNSISAEDSKDYTDIQQTPSDIARLMNKAKKTATKSKSKGKTSEEAYQGGGTIVSYGNLQIQTKIPKSFYSPDIKALLNQGSDLTIYDKSKPTVLIYHSHTTEAYSLLDTGYYISSDARSNNSARNMVRVGDDLAAYLEKQGFTVIHDRTIHDKDYTKSYDNSRVTIEKYLEQYPSIEVTIDVHRDDITYSNKTKVKPTAKINGKKAARMMIISGCEYNRVKNFPDWEENLKFDLQVQNKVNELYPGLMRPILFSERKYNMYETHYSFLLEVGTDANTLDEACYSARLFGNALGQLLNEKYVKE
ncbi:stage II sporulation protein P [uncultured Eubacterium sp.]|mgnify:FL=1|uniref:stage II sporulation protein P n=1 Tax=uncultured Eubacterium sp. TaxID=165185 RepID=UPI0025D83FD6|nr:stage II sporulation protein P [uncultured Eubacterium sp.]